MTRNNILMLTALLAMQLPQTADAQKRWTLRECEDYAIANNISIKQSEVARVKQTYALSTARPLCLVGRELVVRTRTDGG